MTKAGCIGLQIGTRREKSPMHIPIELIPIPVDPFARAVTSLRQRGGRALVESFYLGLARGFEAAPFARPSLYGVERITDVPYSPSGMAAHKLDIYRPTLPTNRPRPAVMYIHGGGFHFMSKRTHWMMGLLFAARGYVVFNVEYRMAPHHKFPAAVIDVLTAYRWVVENRHRFGASGPIVLAGESAGANLAWDVTLSACMPRPEPWARDVFELEQPPAAMVSACGMLQVTHPERYRDKNVPWLFYDRIAEIKDLYLPENFDEESSLRDFADPLLAIERGMEPRHPLPPTIATVGGADPLIDDSERLKKALERLGVAVEMLVYEGEIHSFQPMIFRANARKSWRDTFQFLADEVGIDPDPSQSPLASWLVAPRKAA